jgi:hypothetical protein
MPSSLPTLRASVLVRLATAGCILLLIAALASRARADATCAGTADNPQQLAAGSGQDLVVTGPCIVTGSVETYHYGQVNIYDSGSLQFSDAKIDFWAKSILIQNGGSMLAGVINAGTPTEKIVPIGTANDEKGNSVGHVVIHLYGAEQTDPDGALNRTNGHGVLCKKDGASPSDPVTDESCGISNVTQNDMTQMYPTSCMPSTLPGGVSDCFYKYDALKFDGGGPPKGYFGYKVIGLSFGGTLRLYGFKGALYPDATVNPANTGTSWLRLDSCPNQSSNSSATANCKSGVLQAGATTITVSMSVQSYWQPGDQIAITTTDYLPSHSETATISSINGQAITLTAPLKYPHNASVYSLAKVPPGLTDLTQVDTRAAVALLTRSITIVSGGKRFGEALPPADSKDENRYFGGHIVIRQGFKALQLQGVELSELGQGGKIGHYPIHFHMARKVPAGTFVKDCSVHDSMARAYVLHATQGVLLARDVSYRTIGHSFYLEDGTEINNQLYANLAISAIAAVDDAANDRKVPGILAYTGAGAGPALINETAESDLIHPTLFWALNGWNDFENNMAAGAETCGVCYWMVPGNISGMSRFMFWTGYASEPKQFGWDNTVPLQKFVGNTCSSASTSLAVIADISFCNGVFTGNSKLTPIPNDLAPLPKNTADSRPGEGWQQENYYPLVHGGVRKPSLCTNAPGGDCSAVGICDDADLSNCTPITVDHYTTSFNYSSVNFAAIWFRPEWNLLIDSAVTDQLGGGVSFVTGGGYTRSDVPRGVWNLARKDVFIGNTQSAAANQFAEAGGPVNPNSSLECRNNSTDINYCIPEEKASHIDQGAIYQRENFASNERLFNIYDGPSFQDSNSYLDITTTKLDDCNSSGDKRCAGSAWMEGEIIGVPAASTLGGGACYLPNAAIAWKQPNGFYYPPAFHSANLFFDNVDIRHYVIEPLFEPGTLIPDLEASESQYCNFNKGMWNGFSDVDRQTELNDDDGSLTGLINTVSVNQDPFFNAPTEDVECRSDISANPAGTAKTSPYDYLTAVLYPDDCKNPPVDGKCPTHDDTATWNLACSNQNCFGVPIFRELLTPTENKSNPPSIRMSGENSGQRSELLPNNGRYYIQTTNNQSDQYASIRANLSGAGVPHDDQPKDENLSVSVFRAGKTYHVLLLFAKPNTSETFDIFVGKNGDKASIENSVIAETAQIPNNLYVFTALGSFPGQWQKSYDPATGMLTVTINMNGFNTFQNDYNNSFMGRCQPAGMCTWVNSQCQCNSSSTAYLPDDCTKNPTGICSWATKDIDFPNGGAYGFRFTLPPEFSYAPAATAPPPPNVACFTTANNPGWNVPFNPASATVAGDCFYASSPPSPQFCKSPSGP